MTSLDSLPYRKSKVEYVDTKVQVKKTLTIRFDEVSFSRAMQTLAEESGACVMWSTECDSVVVSGVFIDQSVEDILASIAHRAVVHFTLIGEIYYIGTIRKDDSIYYVSRIPPVDRAELLQSLQGALSTYGTVNVVGSVVVVTDLYSVVSKVATALESIRRASSLSYVCEVYFLRVTEEDYYKVAADLEVSPVDILSSVKAEDILSIYLDLAASSSRTRLDQQAVLYLTEARKASFQDGSSIVVEEKVVSDTGYASTSGYRTFSDGLQLEVTLSRIESDVYSLDMSLDVSVFSDSKSASGVIPQTTKSQLKTPSLLCRDGHFCFVGALIQKEDKKERALISYIKGHQRDVLTVWIRVREISLEKE